jgi:hypothetical protein
MEGGEGNFFFPKFLKLKAPPLKEQKCNDGPFHIGIFSFDPPPTHFHLYSSKWDTQALDC